jgi:hypothetical protein
VREIKRRKIVVLNKPWPFPVAGATQRLLVGEAATGGDEAGALERGRAQAIATGLTPSSIQTIPASRPFSPHARAGRSLET